MLKRRVKFTSGSMKRVWKTVKCQGKIRENSGNFEVEDYWQPCLQVLKQMDLSKQCTDLDQTTLKGAV